MRRGYNDRMGKADGVSAGQPIEPGRTETEADLERQFRRRGPRGRFWAVLPTLADFSRPKLPLLSTGRCR